MTLIQTVALGIIEGLTEFLPISSTAHLILASKLLGLETSNFLKSFEISIQLGAIASIIFFVLENSHFKMELECKDNHRFCSDSDYRSCFL